MQVKAYKLNSFTKSIEGGNPAGVVIDADYLNEVQMQAVAKLVGFSETAFVTKSNAADFRVRFFTPCSEVDLCGHATIAAFSLLRQMDIIKDGEYLQETKAGVLKIKIYGETIYMQQAMPSFFEKLEGEELLASLGINHTDLEDNLPIQAVSTGLKDILVPLNSAETLDALSPDMKLIEKISKKYEAVGFHVFSLTKNKSTTAICRNFAPLYGIPEESATGTSNGALACYLYSYGAIDKLDQELIFDQGKSMGKPSTIKAKLKIEANDLKEIWVGGEAVLIGSNSYQI